MDIDFHFGTIYVLSRWAGFDSYNAKVIATSSQFVDDNYSGDLELVEKAEKTIGKEIIRYSGHELWENIAEKGNEQVWIPFHFLPALEGESETQQLICKKNSCLAQQLSSKLANVSIDDADFCFKLGIGLHVYADTWAHQKFAGITDLINWVGELEFSSLSTDAWSTIETLGKSIFLDIFHPLGHAGAVHVPDMPYVQWKCSEKFTDGRNNWDECIEAAHAIFKIMVQCRKRTDIQDLTENQEKVLLDAFKTIENQDYNLRNDEWINRIHNGEFCFTDFCEDDKHVDYNKFFVLCDMDYPEQFYNALNEHYEWVKSKLLEAHINVLQ